MIDMKNLVEKQSFTRLGNPNACNSNNCLLKGPPRPGGYGPGPQMGPGGPRMMSHGGMPPHPYAGNHRNDKLRCRF